MTNESKFWISINAIFCFGILGVLLISTLYWKDHNTKIVELIGAGVDPVAAMCAMQDDYGTMPVCMVLAAKK